MSLSVKMQRYFAYFFIIRNEATDVTKVTVDCTQFRASHSWIRGFLSRHGLSYRTPTHVAQQNNKTPELKCSTALNFLNKVNLCRMLSEYGIYRI